MNVAAAGGTTEETLDERHRYDRALQSVDQNPGRVRRCRAAVRCARDGEIQPAVLYADYRHYFALQLYKVAQLSRTCHRQCERSIGWADGAAQRHR